MAYSLASTSSATSLFVSDAMVKELSLAAQDAKGGVKMLLHGTVSVTNLSGKDTSGINARAPRGGQGPQEVKVRSRVGNDGQWRGATSPTLCGEVP